MFYSTKTFKNMSFKEISEEGCLFTNEGRGVFDIHDEEGFIEHVEEYNYPIYLWSNIGIEKIESHGFKSGRV